MNPKIITLICCLVLASSNLQVLEAVDTQYVPIPRRYPGIDLPGKDAVVSVQLVYDATCGDCTVFDRVWVQVENELLKSYPGKFSFRYALQVLPHRILSYKCTQAIRYVQDQKGQQQALSLLRYFVQNYKQWSEETILDTPLSTTMDNLARKVSSLMDVEEGPLRVQLNHNSQYDNSTRPYLKYAMGTLHTAFTPIVFINGARLDGAFTMTSDQLLSLLIGLL